MCKDLVHIRENEVYLNMGELLYNVIAVYIITVLIRISAKFESHYNLLAVSRSYLHCSILFKDMECILLPMICNYYYYYYILFLYEINYLQAAWQ